MKFEWDEQKENINIEKHSVSFDSITDLFAAPFITQIDNRKDYGETRFIALGEANNYVFSVVYTIRDVDIYRIISARKASKAERRIYHDEIKNRLGKVKQDGR